MQPGWQLLGGYPEIRQKSAGFATNTGTRGLEHTSLRGQGSAVPSLHPEGVGCNQPLLAHSLLQRVLLDEAKGDCTHALDFEFKGSFKQCNQIWRGREIWPWAEIWLRAGDWNAGGRFCLGREIGLGGSLGRGRVI